MRVWDKQSIQDLLENSDRAVERSVLAIYERQTQDERSLGGTFERNHMGFSGSDGEWLSRIVLLLQGGGVIPGYSMERIRMHMKRYWRQLAEVANRNELEKAKEKKEYENQNRVCPGTPSPGG